MRLAIVVLRSLQRCITTHDFRGTEHVPRTGGVILAANHISIVDPPIVGRFTVDGVGRAPYFLAKSELFTIPVVGRVIRGAGQIPVYRNSANAALALRDAATAIEEGKLVVVYPEGTTTRDPDGWPMTGKTGVARLALQTGAPVIPLAHYGSQRILPSVGRKKLKMFPRSRVTFLAGPAVDLSAWKGADPTPDVLRAMTDAIMTDIRTLLGVVRGETPPTSFYSPSRAAIAPNERPITDAPTTDTPTTEQAG
ncbi:MAG: 1-acyl-sn-glycerol-3-phosphate acyltransferase [Frankiales bacterium]|nr:1-acyl-sn-glycerol-3-phosphate acyltransferase [Frankiales bacterium]